MQIPLLSVCMITYNHEKYIREAINGILMQKTDFRFELVIGEDFSSDKTRQICEEYAKTHPEKIELLPSKMNYGIIPNFIRTLKSCRGKYIAFCEGDDYWTDPYKLQKQVDFLNENKQFPMCFSNSLIVDDDGNITNKDRVPDDKKHNMSQRDILSGYCPPTNTVVLRSAYLAEYYPQFEGLINGDFFLFSLLTEHGDAAYLDFISAAYRLHANSIWSGKDADYKLTNFIKVNRRLENLVLSDNKNIVENSIISSYESLIKLNTEESFTDHSLWTPQTAMLRSIRDIIVRTEGPAGCALSIDNNPTLEKIILRRWPEIEIIEASYPQYDAQNLHQFKDESFDIVFSHQVLEHIPKPWIAAGEMNRVLKKGGIGIHTSCAYNPRHGYPQFKDYYRFLPDGLAELFEDIEIWICDGWGSKQALIYNLAIDDGNGLLGGRRFAETMAKQNDENYPWHTWLVFQKK